MSIERPEYMVGLNLGSFDRFVNRKEAESLYHFESLPDNAILYMNNKMMDMLDEEEYTAMRKFCAEDYYVMALEKDCYVHVGTKQRKEALESGVDVIFEYRGRVPKIYYDG